MRMVQDLQSYHRSMARGFTLLELLTVMAILGILATIALPQFQRARTRALVTAAKQDISTLANAAQLFSMDTGYFPFSIQYDSIDDLLVLTRGAVYISTTNYPDPFQKPIVLDELETQFSDFGTNQRGSKSKHGFVYVNYRDFLTPALPKFNGIGIYSIGPDRQDSWLSLYPLPDITQKSIRRSMLQVYGDNALQPVTIYNPTNGIISNGDFGAFRGEFQGFIPQDF